MSMKPIFAAIIAVACTALPALAEGDAKAGKKVFKKCKACHDVKAGKHKVGPSLFGIVGQAAGTVDGYDRYSDELKASGLTWDEASLSAFLMDPKKTIPGNNMSFSGLKKQKDVDNLIAYLVQEGSK